MHQNLGTTIVTESDAPVRFKSALGVLGYVLPP